MKYVFQFFSLKFLLLPMRLAGSTSPTRHWKIKLARGIWEVMDKAPKTTIKNIHSHEFDKYLAVANPGNGDEFFFEVFLPIKSFYIIF